MPWPHYYARRSKKKSLVPLNPWDAVSTASTWRVLHKTSTRLPTTDSRPRQIIEWGRCPLVLPQKLRLPRQNGQQHEGLPQWPRTNRTNSETMTIQTRLQTRLLVQVRPLKQPQSSLLLSYAWLFISYEHYLFINYHTTRDEIPYNSVHLTIPTRRILKSIHVRIQKGLWKYKGSIKLLSSYIFQNHL